MPENFEEQFKRTYAESVKDPEKFWAKVRELAHVLALLFQSTRVLMIWREIGRGFVNPQDVSLRISPKFSALS